METHSVSLFSQKDLLSSYISAFADMRCRGELIDFNITVRNRSFCGHRLILAAGIPFFRKLFISSEIEMAMDEMDPDVLESVITFAYSGKIEITDGNVRSLLSSSKYLQLAQVHDACWEFLEKRLSPCNVMDFRNLAEKFNRPELVDISDHYIRANTEAFFNSTSLLTLEFTFLKEVIGRDDVNVSSEEKVFEAVIRWVQVSPSEREGLLPELLTAVRLPLLTPDYLIERVCSEELVKSSIPCRELVEEAKNYHLLPRRRSQLSSFASQPRKYVPKPERVSVCAGKKGNGIYAFCDSPSGAYVKLLDSEHEKWITLSTAHYSHHYQDIVQVIASGEKIYTFSCTSIKVFDLKTLAWQTVEEKHMSLISFGVTLHNNKIYFVGGGFFEKGRVLCFDTLVNKWLKENKMTKDCISPGVSSLEEYIYVTGGRSEFSVSKDVLRYDPELDEWTKMASMISPRCRHACCSLNGKVYVCGGTFDGDCLSSAEVYNPLRNYWNPIRSIKFPRRDFSLAPNNGKLYALGKASKAYGRADIEIYDPKYDEWKLGLAVSDEDRCDVFLVSAKLLM